MCVCLCVCVCMCVTQSSDGNIFPVEGVLVG